MEFSLFLSSLTVYQFDLKENSNQNLKYAKKTKSHQFLST
jgi:hypothetical protein